jgi:apolipoprotein N-acyltransferase
MLLLRQALSKRVGSTGMPMTFVGTLWGAAIAAALLAWVVKLTLPPLHPVIVAAAVLTPYGLAYFAATLALRIPEARATVRRVLRR